MSCSAVKAATAGSPAVVQRVKSIDLGSVSGVIILITICKLEHAFCPTLPTCDSEEQLGFTDFVENLKPMADLAQILAGFGLITVLLAILKRNAERRCWRNYKLRVDDWANRLRDAASHHPGEDAEEWKAECERMLTDARFSPLEINSVLDTAVVVAKGIVADKIFR